MKNVLKTALVLIVIVAVFCAAMFALNLHTGPIIERNNAGAANDRLNLVMDGGAGYKDITSTLKDLPASVVKVHEEINGLGYVIEATAKSQYTGDTPMDILIGVSADGKICGIKLVAHSESLIFGADYPDTYLGKDSALSGVELFAGSTFSSKAFKTAVEEAMGVLIANDLIKAGVKSDEQILTELIPTVYSAMAPEGELKANKMEVSGNIKVAYKSTNDTGYAYIIADGDATYLVIVDAQGAAKVYDKAGTDVTASKSSLVEMAKAHIESSALAALKSVMPNATTFEEITSTISTLPANIKNIYKEGTGLGYVVICTAESQYSAAPMEIVLGVTADGKISGVEISSYNDTASFDFRAKDPNYLASYIGKDSALADIGLVAGSTFSSTAFKGAVAGAMELLVSNNLVQAGVKSPEQILTEMIPTVAEGYNKLVDATATGNIIKAFKFETGTGFAYIMSAGDANYLAVVNAMGVCKVYDVEGNDVTEAQAALATEAKTQAAKEQKSYTSDLTKKIEKMMAGATDITALQLDTFNTVASAVSFTVDGAVYYGFYSRSYGFHQMDVYFIIDANGAIVKMDAKQFIFEEEYFGNFGGMDVNEYKDGFAGLTGDTWTGEAAIIATATMTSNAMKQSTTDTFDAFNSITGGGK